MKTRSAAARGYHERTKHRPGRPSANPYGLEWDAEPDPFKRYPRLKPLGLPPGAGTGLDVSGLSRLLRLGAGVHPRRASPRYRTFMSAGALHPVELYVANGRLDGLAPGVWHFHPGEAALRRLRDEDPRAVLGRAAAAPEAADAQALLVLTGMLWRTAWKYGARGWRHLLWDAGALLANLLALAQSAGLPARLVSAFSDREVNALLGVEPAREAAVALLALGAGSRSTGPESLGPVSHEVAPLSPRERRFPEAEQVQWATELAGEEEVHAWRAAAPRAAGKPAGEAPPPAPPDQLEGVILRRGSARDFTPEPIGNEELVAILAAAGGTMPGDLPPLCSTFVLAHAVDGLGRGAHRFEPPDRFEPVRTGELRRATAHACLDQAHGGHAAAVVFLCADLDRLLAQLGGRAYRGAQLEAGVRAGRASLAAYARGLGATGLTFYDDEVRRLLKTREEPMMCVALGVDARRPGLRPAARSCARSTPPRKSL